MPHKQIERYVAIVIAIVIVGFCMYLVVWDEPFKNDLNRNIVIVLLSVACAGLGGCIPGFIIVKMNVPGLAVRGAGAASMFLIVFFFAPKMFDKLQPPKVDVDFSKEIVDFRPTKDPKNYSHDDQMLSDLAVTVPLIYRNRAQPARNAHLEAERLYINFGDYSFELPWQESVNLVDGGDSWLAILGSVGSSKAGSLMIESGGSVGHETLFAAYGHTSWGDFVQAILKTEAVHGAIKVLSTVDGDRHVTECLISIEKVRSLVERFVAEKRSGYISTPCLQRTASMGLPEES